MAEPKARLKLKAFRPQDYVRMHNAHRLPLKGESMRKILGDLTEGEHLE